MHFQKCWKAQLKDANNSNLPSNESNDETYLAEDQGLMQKGAFTVDSPTSSYKMFCP